MYLKEKKKKKKTGSSKVISRFFLSLLMNLLKELRLQEILLGLLILRRTAKEKMTALKDVDEQGDGKLLQLENNFSQLIQLEFCKNLNDSWKSPGKVLQNCSRKRIRTLAIP